MSWAGEAQLSRAGGRGVAWTLASGRPGAGGPPCPELTGLAPSPEAGPAPRGLYSQPGAGRTVVGWAPRPSFSGPWPPGGWRWATGPSVLHGMEGFRARGWLSGCEGSLSMLGSGPRAARQPLLSPEPAGGRERPGACPEVGAGSGGGPGGRQVGVSWRGSLPGGKPGGRPGRRAPERGLRAVPDPEGAGEPGEAVDREQPAQIAFRG